MCIQEVERWQLLRAGGCCKRRYAAAAAPVRLCCGCAAPLTMPAPLALLFVLLWASHTRAVLCPERVNVEPISKFCQDFTKVCVDHGDYVLYENKHNPRHEAFTGIPQIKLDSVHVDYYGFGDVWGTEFLYPHPLLRPATDGEESKELQEPQFSRW